jgi:Flp pilus assembly protein TadD
MNRIAQGYFLIVLLACPGITRANGDCEQWIAKLASGQGKVDIQHPNETRWLSAQQEATFCPGDKIRTGKRSRATLLLSNQTIVTLDQNSTLIFSPPEEKNIPWLLKLLQGSGFFRSRQTQQLNIHTPFINAVHEGTEFLVEVDATQTQISVFDGQVAAQNEFGKIDIHQGFTGIGFANLPPQIQALTIKPEDAVQWSLYYPPIIDDSSNGRLAADSNLIPALEAYRQGHSFQSLAALDAAPIDQHNVHYLTLKAALLLTVGRVDEAGPLINQAQQLEPTSSDAFALKAIIAVAKNQQQQALEWANQAVTANPESSIAKIAQSYAYQSLFNIDEALKSTQEAVRLAPDNALAWARLTELHLSNSDQDAALLAAQKSSQLNPRFARTLTLSGFANLARTKIEQAKEDFEQALALDSSDPLARLGLGLSKIRKGDIEEGKTDLETAVNLDPNNSVLRSYLGKAYYELRNSDFASTEFKIAKAMDPKDPTPWFYDAILKQTTNRPVEALHDMQQAIELNDNRGVYRSSLLMDKDLAARSAAQGRIYNELGFQQLGLLEGWKSANKDPGNYSAHRLLADNYAALPRHELARVSELLQSQLLQPNNITPIQPNLAENNLFILNGLGPSDLSYNEFNPLFEYNRLAMQVSGLYGGNNTWGNNAAFSGLQDNFSFSLGQFHYETDGFRNHNFLRKDIYNAFAQSQVTDKLNLQAEFRHEERDNEDLSLNFELNNFSKDFKEQKTIDSYRAGGRYEFSPNSSLIASLIYQEVDINQKSSDLLEFLGFFFKVPKDIAIERNGFISETQHRYFQDKLSLTTGFGHIDQQINQVDNRLGTTTKTSIDFSRTNFYNYSTINFSEKISTTFGLSVDFFKNGSQNQTPINPKFGLIWTPSTSTIFRAAVFRGLSVTRYSSQSIEPTQVAGFNQFFDDITGTIAWRFGAGVDHKLSRNIATGLEYSERKLYIPGGIESVDRSEQLGRAYLYYTPYDWIALSTEYYYESINQPGRPITFDNALNGGLFDSVETHRIPLTLGLFHPSGFSLKIKNSFIQQKGIFQNPDQGNRSAGDSDFFIVDLNLSYRFPQRYGMISLGINNLFNDQIHYQNTNNNETIVAPGQVLYSRINLAF